MKRFANPERRQDAPPPGDPGAGPQVQGYDVQQPEPIPDPPPKSDTTRPDDRGKQRAPPESMPEDRDRDQTRQRPPAEDRDQTRQRPPAEDRDPTRQRTPAEDRDQVRQRQPVEDRDQARQRQPAEDRDQARQRQPAEDRDQARQRPPVEDRDQTRQRQFVDEREQAKPRPPAEDRIKQRAPPAEYSPQDRERTGQRLLAPEDRGKQRAPQELLSEERDPNSTNRRPSPSEDRSKARAPGELLGPQSTERSPLFSTRSNTPHPTYAAAGPSRGYDTHSHRQPSPVDSDDILIVDNRTQPPPQQNPPQQKTGLWARITSAMKDKGDSELEPGRTHTRGRLLQQPTRPNVILFGSHGAGKSSLINMLAKQEASRDSDRGLPAFASGGYLIDIGGKEIVVWDVLGLHKGDGGREHDTISDAAAQNLHYLIHNKVQGSVNLLVHCINAKHPSEAVEINYEAFYRIIGGKKVPIVLVVTGLEDEDPMEAWWGRNEADIRNRGMTYDGHACITTIRGKPLKNGHGYWYDEQYEQSRLTVMELIKAKLRPPVLIREEGKLAELRELLREQKVRAVTQSQNGDKGKKSPSERTWASREVNGGHRTMQVEQWDDDTADRIQREGRTAALALLGGLFAVFIVLQSGITGCV